VPGALRFPIGVGADPDQPACAGPGQSEQTAPWGPCRVIARDVDRIRRAAWWILERVPGPDRTTESAA